jgi:hypothetical protein
VLFGRRQRQVAAHRGTQESRQVAMVDRAFRRRHPARHGALLTPGKPKLTIEISTN